MNEMLIMSGKDTGLLRMTKWMVDYRRTGLFVMTDLEWA